MKETMQKDPVASQPESNKKKRCSQSFETVKRDDYYNARKEKNPPPPCGFYAINHKLVERTSPSRRWNLSKTQSRKVIETAEPALRMIVIKDR